MTVDFVPLDPEEVQNRFRLIGDRIHRISQRDRWNGLDVTGQKTVRVGDARVTLNRVKYVLEQGESPQGEVMVNDHGELVDVTDNHFRMAMILRDTDKVSRTENGRYVGRYVDSNGVRVGKVFDSYEEAREFAVDNTRRVWGDVAREYGFEL